MTTVIEKKEIECPGCKQKIDVEVEKTKPKVIIREETTETHTEHNHEHTITPPKDDEHDIIAKNMPLGVNFGRCKDGKCGHRVIKNAKGITTDFKTCPNCGDNTNSKKSKICKTCGKKPDDEKDWDESDVKIEVEEDEDEDDE